MKITLGCVLDESTDMEAHARAENIRYAWDRWAAECCIEWNGDHLWEMELYHPEDDSYVSIRCAYCPESLDHYGPELVEFVDVDLGDIQVEDGKHNSPVPLIIPVTVRVEWSFSSNPISGSEWDVEVIVAQRGEAREVTA